MRVLALAAGLLVAACSPGEPAPPLPAAPAPGPARIVALSPSATEVVAALDAVPLLVGVDRYSTYPPEVQALPKVGDFLHPSVEVIVQMRPTLVIADDVHTATAAALRDANVTTLVCPVHTIADVKAAILQVGAQLGRERRATEVTAGIDAALAAARAQRPAVHPRVLVVLDRNAGDLGGLVAASTGSYVDELLAIVGADNVLAASPTPYPKISMEEVLRGRPDVILDLSYAGHEGTAAWAAVDVPAVHAHRVRAIDDPVLLAPSPRVGLALAQLAAAIAPPAR